jgi:osmotically-inducible protein OsmY
MPQSDKAASPVDDQTLQSKVKDQLAANPALSGVNVTANNGVITLEGTVASKEDRQQAKKMAQSVPGVKSVKDKLSVAGATTKPPTSYWMQESKGSSSSQGSSQTGAQSPTGMPQSDANAGSTDNTTLQAQIQNAIKNEPTLAADAIVVAVTDNSVDLSGTAASKKDKQTAKRIAQSFASNRKVTDSITVAGNNSMPQSDKTDQSTPRNPDKDNKKTPPDQTMPHL